MAKKTKDTEAVKVVTKSNNPKLDIAVCDFTLRSQNVTSKTGHEKQIGKSIKDLGKKWFAFTLMRDMTVTELIHKIQQA